MAYSLPRVEPERFPRFSGLQAVVCCCLAAAIDIGVGLSQFKALIRGSLLNPDSYMRLVRLQDIIRQHAAIDIVARDASGLGTLLYWSHLLDSMLLVLATPLMPLLGEHEALRWAGISLGPLSVGLLGSALAWAGAPLSDAGTRWTAALCGVLAMPVIGYAMPGVVHHHILVALAAVMCAGWAARAATQGARAGWQLGLWAGFGVWLSPEVVPFALMALGGVGTGWLMQPDRRAWGEAGAAGGAAFAAIIGLALAVDPPFGGYLSADLDRLSLAWLDLGLLSAVIGWSWWGLDRLGLSIRTRALLGCGAATACSLVWLALFPAVLRGPAGVMSPEQAHAFLDVIAEMRPIRSLGDAGLFLLPGVFGTVVAGIQAVRRRSPGWSYVVFCFMLLLLLGAQHRRFSTYSACAGAAMMPIAITMISRRYDSWSPALAAAARLSLLFGLIVAPLIIHRATAGAAATAPRVAKCDLQAAAPMLAPFSGQVVLTDVNDAPEVLYRTGVLTVGSLYVSNPEAFLRLRAAWRSSRDGTIPPEVRATKASLILFCRDAGRSFIVRDLPQSTLWDSLSHNTLPVWLQKVGSDDESGYDVYRISR
jgi:hypothetical protein